MTQPDGLVSRRKVLAGLAGAGVVTLVGTSPLLGGMEVLAAPGQANDRVLVNIFLRGGADGLNIVVPSGDDDYRRLRPTIGVPTSSLVDLDGFFGLNSAFGGLHPLYQDGKLAFVHASGSNDPSRSHFTAMDNMDLAFGQTGWMQRALVQEALADPVAAVTIDDRTAPALRGPMGGIAMRRVQALKRSAGALADLQPTLQSMYPADDPLLGAATNQAFAAVEQLTEVSVNPGVDYPANRLANRLIQTAALIKADVGVRMVAISIGGWDHHTDIVPRMERLGVEVGSALAAFDADLGSTRDRVVTVVMSEFGRTAAENGGKGTDHGHGNVMTVMGGALPEGGGGQVHLRNGRWVGLGAGELYQERDLAITTDYRSVLYELLDRHMGIADDGTIFPGFQPNPLGLLPSNRPRPTTTTTVGSTTTMVPTTTTTRPSTTRPSTTRPSSTTITSTTRPADGEVAGMVDYVDGLPAAGVKVDLFTAAGGVRQDFLGTTRTGRDGTYRFSTRPGPHVATFVAPQGDAFLRGQRFHQAAVSVEAGVLSAGVDAVLLGGGRLDRSGLAGIVADESGRPVADVKIDLFLTAADGSRGRFLTSARTDGQGRYRFTIAGGCYVLTMIAPDGRSFTNGRPWHQPAHCVDAGAVLTGIDAVLAGTGADSGAAPATATG